MGSKSYDWNVRKHFPLSLKCEYILRWWLIVFFLVTQLLKYNLEKKSSELVRGGNFPFMQTVDIGLGGVWKNKREKRGAGAKEG